MILDAYLSKTRVTFQRSVYDLIHCDVSIYLSCMNIGYVCYMYDWTITYSLLVGELASNLAGNVQFLFLFREMLKP
jgi:hypothetical protein